MSALAFHGDCAMLGGKALLLGATNGRKETLRRGVGRWSWRCAVEHRCGPRRRSSGSRTARFAFGSTVRRSSGALWQQNVTSRSSLLCDTLSRPCPLREATLIILPPRGCASSPRQSGVPARPERESTRKRGPPRRRSRSLPQGSQALTPPALSGIVDGVSGGEVIRRAGARLERS